MTLLGLIADIAGILGLALTSILLIRTEVFHRETALHLSNYKKRHKKIQKELTVLRDGILKDKIFSKDTVEEFHKMLTDFDVNSKRTFKPGSRCHLRKALELVKKPISEKSERKILREITYFTVLFDRKEP
jgi:hypothetical protein